MKNIIKSFSLILFFFALSISAQSNKPVIGVGEIQTTIGGNPSTYAQMLETALSQTNKFEIIERARMDDLLGEQALAAGGLTQGSGQIGGLSGVDYLVYGTITKLGKEGEAMSFGGIGGGSSKTTMSVDIKVVDARSGSVRISKTVERTAKGAMALSLGDIQTANEEADPLGEVQRMTANAVASLIAQEIFPIKIINVAKGQAYVNYGPPNVYPGLYLKVVELGGGFVDPDTGETLGAEETYIGAIKITDAKSKFSIGTVLEGSLSNGMIASVMDKKDGKKAESGYRKICKKAKNCLDATFKKYWTLKA